VSGHWVVNEHRLLLTLFYRSATLNHDDTGVYTPDLSNQNKNLEPAIPKMPTGQTSVTIKFGQLPVVVAKFNVCLAICVLSSPVLPCDIPNINPNHSFLLQCPWLIETSHFSFLEKCWHSSH
jgi:hypothetical protein